MDRRIGITVKARTRDRIEREKAPVNLFRLEDRKKLTGGCDAFDCDPWLAIYVEATQFADLYLVSLDHYESAYGAVGRVLYSWKMATRRQEVYASDPEVKHVRIEFTSTNRWPGRD